MAFSLKWHSCEEIASKMALEQQRAQDVRQSLSCQGTRAIIESACDTSAALVPFFRQFFLALVPFLVKTCFIV